MITIILIVLLVLVLSGGGYGIYGGHIGLAPSPLGILLLVILIFLLVGLFGGPRWGWY